MRFLDYRDVAERDFDAISSIGLTEHIGVRNYPSYFGFLLDRLKPGGRLLNHSITRPDNRYRSTGAFIDRYIFPDGELIGSGRIIAEAQDAGFEVRHEENLREHYALTLAAWSDNLVKPTGTRRSPRSATPPPRSGASTWPPAASASNATPPNSTRSSP